MNFKVDENLPVEISELLIREGFDSKTVIDQNLRGSDDQSLIKLCREENRILITLDIDFSNISYYPPEEFKGIIILKLSNQSKNHIIQIFKHLLEHFNKQPLEQHLWIVEETRIRIRGKEQS